MLGSSASCNVAVTDAAVSRGSTVSGTIAWPSYSARTTSPPAAAVTRHASTRRTSTPVRPCFVEGPGWAA